MKRYFNYNKYVKWCYNNQLQDDLVTPEMHGIEVTDGYIEKKIGVFTVKFFMTDEWVSKRKLKPIV